jgi:uncharacterized SAM-binding protein YcdF (DUF218 family)
MLIMFSLMTSLVSNLFLWLWLLAAVFIWWASRANRKARRRGVILLLLLWFLGTRPFADAFLWPLESRYEVPDVASLQKQGVKQVVVLTGGGYPIQGETLSSTFPHASMYRFLGGLELCSRLGKDCLIIFSGSAGRQRGHLTVALTMQELSHLIAPGRQVLAEARSESTAEHSTNVRPLLREEPFVLVTSAYHMFRSMRSFNKAGLDPVPYPVDFLSSRGYGWLDVLPSFEDLWKMNLALREYQALILYTVKGW